MAIDRKLTNDFSIGEEMSVYENDQLIKALDGSFHPGGDALTLRALDLAALPAGASVLDVGCGTGNAVRLMRERAYEAEGIDASGKLVSLANSDYVTVGRAEEIGRTPQRYDAVMTECVFALIDRARFLDAVNKALSAEGKLIFCELYRKEGPLPPGILSREELVDLLGEKGFVLSKWRDEDDAYLSYIAQLIMSFGTEHPIISEIISGCTGGCEFGRSVGELFKMVKLGYALAVWERKKES